MAVGSVPVGVDLQDPAVAFDIGDARPPDKDKGPVYTHTFEVDRHIWDTVGTDCPVHALLLEMVNLVREIAEDEGPGVITFQDCWITIFDGVAYGQSPMGFDFYIKIPGLYGGINVRMDGLGWGRWPEDGARSEGENDSCEGLGYALRVAWCQENGLPGAPISLSHIVIGDTNQPPTEKLSGGTLSHLFSYRGVLDIIDSSNPRRRIERSLRGYEDGMKYLIEQIRGRQLIRLWKSGLCGSNVEAGVLIEPVKSLVGFWTMLGDMSVLSYGGRMYPVELSDGYTVCFPDGRVDSRNSRVDIIRGQGSEIEQVLRLTKRTTLFGSTYNVLRCDGGRLFPIAEATVPILGNPEVRANLCDTYWVCLLNRMYRELLHRVKE